MAVCSQVTEYSLSTLGASCAILGFAPTGDSLSITSTGPTQAAISFRNVGGPVAGLQIEFTGPVPSSLEGAGSVASNNFILSAGK